MVLTAKKEKRSLTDDTVKTTTAKNNSNLFNQTILISLKQKLEQESAKSMFLKEALAAQKQKYQEIHKELSNQHLSQVLELENMVKIAQDIAKKEIEKNKESFEKLVLSTNIIEELTSENENLQLQLEILGNE